MDSIPEEPCQILRSLPLTSMPGIPTDGYSREFRLSPTVPAGSHSPVYPSDSGPPVSTTQAPDRQ